MSGAHKTVNGYRVFAVSARYMLLLYYVLQENSSKHLSMTCGCDYMKKKTVSVVLFLTVFVATYLVICFAIPGMRIKLEAEPVEYFFKSITHMVFFKAIISLVVALIFGVIPLFLGKKK